MNLQKKILDQYFELKGEPTFKEISNDTGIQVTRVFRLYNGAVMKLSEFQIFDQKIKELMGLSVALEDLAKECSLKLSPTALKELEVFLLRKIQIWGMKNVKSVEEDKAKVA